MNTHACVETDIKLLGSPTEDLPALGFLLTNRRLLQAMEPSAFAPEAAAALSEYLSGAARRASAAVTRVAVTCAIIGADGAGDAPRLVASAGAGYPVEESWSRIAETLLISFARGAGAGPEGPRSAVGLGGGGTGAGLWEGSAARQSREASGLDEYVRWLASSSPMSRRALAVQVDHVRGLPWPGEAMAKALELTLPLLARLYDGLIGCVEQRREELLLRVSPSQRAILSHLAAGQTEREIAKAVCRSPHTVHDHIKTIYQALGICSRLELHDLWHARREPPASLTAAGRAWIAPVGGGHVGGALEH